MANNNIKNIFNNASRNVSNFYSYLPEENTQMEGEKLSTWEKLKKAIKGAASDVGSGQRLEVYNSYLNTIQHLKNASRGISLEGAKVSTRPVTSQTGQPERIRTASFENQLENWNSRFRQFAIRRYYESIGSGK